MELRTNMKFLQILRNILILVCFNSTSAYSLEQRHQEIVKPIIEAFNSKDKEVIANLFIYPFGREYPIPSINDKTEMVLRFNEVFDAKLTKMIVDSDIEKDWSAMGWRGIMLSRGVLWLDETGKIFSINYQSDAEKEIKSLLIAKQKITLHSSVSVYKKPILEWKTNKFRIRIDDLGDYNYRYSAWSVEKTSRDKPDIVLEKGEISFDGSGGNHSYTFMNGKYKYLCYVAVLGNSESSLGSLEVFRGDELILSERVLEVLSK